MTEAAVVDITCERCRKNRKDVSLDRRRLAQVRWPTVDAKAQVFVTKRLNQAGIEQGWTMPGSGGSRSVAVSTRRDVVEFVATDDDERRELHCRGCGAGFAYSRLELAAMAGRGRATRKQEIGISPNLGRVHP